jgi:protein gp37
MMSDKTKIEWANATWNPITGCTPISDGCTNCYAKRLVKRFPALHGHDLIYETLWPKPFNEIQFHPGRLHEPLKWKKPRRLFVCSMSDLFHEDVDLEWVKKIYTVIMESWHRNLGHTFMVLTKRPERMAEIINPFEPLPNLWLGVTAENQQSADERIPILLNIPAAVRFVSIEPMLEPVDFGLRLGEERYENCESCSASPVRGQPYCPGNHEAGGIDWVILGAESGPNRRPCKTEWMIDVVNQCDDAGVPVFVKQIHDYRGRVIHDINQFPTQLQFREMPK